MLPQGKGALSHESREERMGRLAELLPPGEGRRVVAQNITILTLLCYGCYDGSMRGQAEILGLIGMTVFLIGGFLAWSCMGGMTVDSLARLTDCPEAVVLVALGVGIAGIGS